MCASVDEVFTLEEDPCCSAGQVTQFRDRSGAAKEVTQQSVDLFDEARIIDRFDEGFFELVKSWDEELGDVLSAEISEVGGKLGGVLSRGRGRAFAGAEAFA